MFEAMKRREDISCFATQDIPLLKSVQTSAADCSACTFPSQANRVMHRESTQEHLKFIFSVRKRPLSANVRKLFLLYFIKKLFSGHLNLFNFFHFVLYRSIRIVQKKVVLIPLGFPARIPSSTFSRSPNCAERIRSRKSVHEQQ
jgi:hypothetical protein